MTHLNMVRSWERNWRSSAVPRNTSQLPVGLACPDCPSLPMLMPCMRCAITAPGSRCCALLGIDNSTDDRRWESPRTCMRNAL